MRYIFWQNVLTDHQSHTYDYLFRICNGRMLVYTLADKMAGANPDTQGHKKTKSNFFHPNLIPSSNWFAFCLKQLIHNKNSIHIFASPFENYKIILILLSASFLKIKIFLISEPYSFIRNGYLNDGNRILNFIKYLIRPIVYKFYSFLIKRNVLGIFSISTQAILQYNKLGFDDGILIPFGYFVDSKSVSAAKKKISRSADNPLRLVFVGSIIHRKGIDIAIEAITKLNIESKFDIRLDVYGTGDIDKYIKTSPYISYKGIIPYGKSESVISLYDILILPSRYDGWGVVINEAINAHVPVICSDKVGASCLISKWGCGSVFSVDQDNSLHDELAVIYSNPHLLQRFINRTTKCANFIKPKIAAAIMYKNLSNSFCNNKRPKSPWYI